MSKAADEEIVALSLQLRAVVVTLDADFHAIPAVSGGTRPFRNSHAVAGFGH
jgi:predicted nuclease of predicted toxin-antitoxin system